MSTTGISAFYQGYLPLLEKYILSTDKISYLESIMNQTDRKMLALLIDPLPDNYEDIFKQLKIPSNVRTQILSCKLLSSLRKAQSNQQKSQALQKYLKEHYKGINFEYPKLADTSSFTAITSNKQNSEENEKQSKLVLPQSLSQYIENLIEKDPKKFQTLSQFGIKQLSENFLMNLNLDNKQYLMDRIEILRTFNDSFVTNFVISLAENKSLVKKTDFYQQISDQTIRNLSKSQINHLKSLKSQIMKNPAFIKVWFQVNYLPQIQQDKSSYNKKKSAMTYFDQRRHILVKILKQLKELNSLLLRPYENHLLFEILVLDLKRQDPSRQLFFKFLNSVEGVSQLFSNEFNQTLQKKHGGKSLQNFSAIQSSQILSASYTSEELIQEYVKKLFKKYKNTDQLKSQLSKYLDFHLVNSFYARSKLEEGEQVPNLTDYLQKSEIDDLKKSKQLTIVQQKTQNQFKPQDDVILTVRIKNIQQIKLKIYEMNMQQFYLENPYQQIDQKIDLHYLNPTYEQLIVIKGFKNSYHVIQQQIKVDKIKKCCGFYVVELVGEGISSRAVIRKGAIACLQESHIDGKLLKFYDEQGNKVQNLRLWINGRHQTLNKPQYLIPFDKNPSSLQIIAIRQNYAQKLDIYLDNEYYYFQVGLIYNHESFIVGKKSKIIIHPVLKLSQRKISLQNLQNIKITANLINNQNIKSTETFENVKFSDQKDYILQIPIKSYTQSIQVVIDAEVKKIDGQVVKLSFDKTIVIDLMEGNTNFLDMYLKRTFKGKRNVLNVTGMNGESMPNLDVNFQLQFYGTTEKENKVLKTNSKGQIDLGNLQYLTTLKASINTFTGSFSRTWDLSDHVQQVAFCNSQLTYHVQDTVIIPLPFDWHLSSENIDQFIGFSQVITENGKSTYQNFIDQVKIIKENEATYLHIEKLRAGTYNLNFLKLQRNISIEIIPGRKWENGEVFCQKRKTHYRINQSPQVFVTIGEVKQQRCQKQKTKKITIPINMSQEYKQKIDLNPIRVHVILKNSTDSIDINMLQNFPYEDYTQNTYSSLSMIYCQQSKYYSNKTLSDEHSYVLNRQNQRQLIGNNLEKPRIFLKRTEVRETDENQEQLNKEGEYDDYGPGGGGGGDQAYMCARRGYGNDCFGGKVGYVCVEYTLNCHNNYLGLSGHSILNYKYKDCTQITIPSGYNEVDVILIGQSIAIKKTFFLEEQTKEKTKDLEHLGLKQKSQTTGWSMQRQIYPLRKGQKKIISRGSTWSTVCLSNILQFALIKGHKLPLWVSQWKTYSQNKKLQVYDKQVCHELNVFIKHHDLEFFNKIIEPFIRNKITKTFVDLCLLQSNECLQFVSAHKIQTLNEFQKILLIECLMYKGMKEEALSIASSIELYQKSTKQSFQVYKQLFDIVLNSKSDDNKMKKLLVHTSCMNPFMPAMVQPASDPFCNENQQCAMMYDQACELQCQECQDDGEYSDQQVDECDRRQSVRRGKVEGGLLRRSSLSKAFKPGFKQVQKTKQYTQTTYTGLKNPSLSQTLVKPSPFWSHLASHLTSQQHNKPFLTQAFLYFTTELQFTLACCFLSNDLNADYQLNNQGENVTIEANNSFVLFVKQVKELDYVDKFGVLINQRFFDPLNRFAYEGDGMQVEKTVEVFLAKKHYTLQTVVTNTSGTNLELQLLMDIPNGSLPLMSHEYVQIINVNVNSFSTISFQRQFYFPTQGQFVLYPANASRNNVVIAKAKKLPIIQVKESLTLNKLQSFNDVMRSGSKKDILEYIQKQNIFDPKIFPSYSILWMLKDRDFFNSVIKILRNRNFYDQTIWSFSIYHKDQTSMLQYIEASRVNGLKSVDIPIFQYFPYFSRRTHKFMNEDMSTIRNVQFKETYTNFIINSLIQQQFGSAQKIVLAYYLLLQDRIDECSKVLKSLSQQQKKAHQIQSDYLACYLSMYQDYPNFTIASSISQKYQNYPIDKWRKMFNQIRDTLKQYHQDVDLEEDAIEKTVCEFKTIFLNEGDNLKITVPSDTKVQVAFYDVNLQLYFSDYPFDQVKSLSVIKPKIYKTFESSEFREEKIFFSQVQHLKNVIVEIYEFKEGIPPLRVGSFFWVNPKIKVKLNQNQGTLQVFLSEKKKAGCYVKVYSKGTNGVKFYRDGYTDISGKFKYVLADLQGLSEFSMLTLTKQGGIISRVNPPSTVGYY